jgi:hypothetical protein
MNGHLFFFALMAALLAGCTPAPSATLLNFSEREAVGAAYAVRMVVTDAYLRIDEGEGSDGFILLDRARRAIHSVSHADRAVLVIEPLAVTLQPPAKFEHAVRSDAESYPAIAGHPVRHFFLTTNNVVCFEVFAAGGLLPDAVAALRQYHEILAGEHAATIAALPADLRTDCDLADEIFLPARHLAQGFPVRQRNGVGRVRELTNYEVGSKVEPKLFELPAEYRRYRAADMRK